MEVKNQEFLSDLAEAKEVCLDSSILIYHLEDIKPYSFLTASLITKVAQGELDLTISTLSLTELLTQPYRQKNEEKISRFEEFIFSLPYTSFIEVNLAIAKEAARLRAIYNIRTPDAILMATAINKKVDIFLTNDEILKKVSREKVSVLVLEDFIRDKA